MREQFPAVGILPCDLGVGEMQTDITQCHGAEKRITDGMQQHIGIAVA